MSNRKELTKEEKKALYKNKEFYEIVDGKLVGPLDNIYYAYKVDSDNTEDDYAFCEFIDDMFTRAFTKDEIYVLDTSIGHLH